MTAVVAVLAGAVLLGAAAAIADRAVTARGGPRGATTEVLRSGVRLLVKGRRTTVAGDRLLWRTGVAAVPVLAIAAAAVVPVAGRSLLSTSADLVWFNAMEALMWAAVWLVGWGPNSIHPLVGGYRFLAQGLAYELPLMFSLITAGLAAGSLRATDVVAAQQGLWFVVTMPVAFVVFVASAAAFAFWGPFASPASSDIAGGVLAELSGPDRLLVQVGRYTLLGVSAAMAAALFLGGGHGPWLPDVVWTAVKSLAVLGALVWLGRRLPVVRPDRFVDVAWMVLVPLTLVQALVVALLVLAGAY
ncbi:MAG TPA: NADH-quinone oxidoreductase subunit H [Actinomycetales bacterium]|nr:NADH-quinone oxidoreductase subunit H [Actinomycetales bacterium]